jgi:hypothetical protein
MTRVDQVVELMYTDQGANVDPNFVLPTEDAEGIINWDRVEKFLATLSEDELETFAIGDQDEAAELVKNEEGVYAHRVLEELFMAIGA